MSLVAGWESVVAGDECGGRQGECGGRLSVSFQRPYIIGWCLCYKIMTVCSTIGTRLCKAVQGCARLCKAIYKAMQGHIHGYARPYTMIYMAIYIYTCMHVYSSH